MSIVIGFTCVAKVTKNILADSIQYANKKKKSETVFHNQEAYKIR